VDGTAFVNALEQRTSSFGSLTLDFADGYLPFSKQNFKRLYALKVFDKLTVTEFPEDCDLLPALVKKKYELTDYRDPPEEFPLPTIANKEVYLNIRVEKMDVCQNYMVPLLNRLATLSHLEKLELSLIEYYDDRLYEEPEEEDDTTPLNVMEALICVVCNNPHLTHLKLAGIYWDEVWFDHLQQLFLGMEDHPGMCMLVLEYLPWRYFCQIGVNPTVTSPAEYYPWLDQLLTRNRAITVVDESGGGSPKGSSTDKLQKLNHFYCGSAALRKDPVESRPVLVGKALTTKASRNFHYTALLLSDHVDTLCEFISDMDLEDVTEVVIHEATIRSEDITTLKRKATTTPSPSHTDQKVARCDK
jgi:hypothetical protein